ncbi:MAG: glycoside hydrolase family 3 C-terminal domain-containing protein [Clostridia bacterium]|nr:glycoside hydrolase family 3 C-terminal domain-containing protein [Clostridia bacterium]
MITVKKLTLEEKLRLLTGKNLWQTEDLGDKVRSIFLADGPHGLRKMKLNAQGWYENIPSLAHPNLVNIANTWNIELARKVGVLIAEDCIEAQVDILLAPGVNIKRTPLCGRNFEYFSEDPYLSGVMAKNYIEGVQSRGVGTCLKHFCVNNREIARYCQSSELSERTLHEIYLPAFEIALKANPVSVMCAYNPINGVYASENKHLLTTVLREQFGYKGLVVSDWASVKNSAKSLKAGLDLRMPHHENAFNELKAAYDSGYITEEEIDCAATRILETVKKLDSMHSKHKITHSDQQRKTSALEIAEEGMVLLKNNGVLPIGEGSVCVIGELNFHPYMGGGGAACVEKCSAYTPLPLHELLGYAIGRNVTCSTRVMRDGLNPSHNDREGAAIACKHDISVVLVGLGPEVETEGKDRSSLRLSEKDERLIKLVAATGTKTVIVIEAGSAIDMSSWIDLVDAVVFAGYSGDNVNDALANILSGKVCPSGKLSETFPFSLEDTYCKSDSGNGNVEVYSDGVLVGYRYYDTNNIPVRFPFGFGLSYAQFEYSDLAIEKTGETNFLISFNVKNLSSTDGKEVSQLYVSDPVSTVFKPEKELKEFKKTLIKAGECVRVEFELDENAFAHYDVIDGKKYVENGEFIISVGSSSRDLPLKARVEISLPDETQHSAI